MWLRKIKTLLRLKLEASKLSNPVVNENCRKFEVNTRILSVFVVNDLLPIVGFSPFPLNELILMSAALCRIRPTYVFEWGTNVGKSARIFYETSKKFNLAVTIHSIDLPDDVYHSEHPGKQRGAFVKGYREVKLHEGDGLDTALRITSSLEKDARFLFFLDGDHSYNSVLRELSGIIDNFSSPNILIHDTFHQSSESGYNIGPYKAIKDILSNRSTSYDVISTNTGLPGMTLLYNL